MPRETIRYDADTIWIRCGYGATRYDTLVRESDDSPPPDRVREAIKFLFPIRRTQCLRVHLLNPYAWLGPPSSWRLAGAVGGGFGLRARNTSGPLGFGRPHVEIA